MEKDEEKRKSGFVGVKIGKIDPRLLDCELKEEDGNFYATGIIDPLKKIVVDKGRSKKSKQTAQFPRVGSVQGMENKTLSQIREWVQRRRRR